MINMAQEPYFPDITKIKDLRIKNKEMQIPKFKW